MNTWILEKDKKQLKKLSKVLGLIDMSINITHTFHDLVAMQTRLQTAAPPELLVVQHEPISGGTTLLSNKSKIILPGREKAFVYHAFCPKDIQHLGAEQSQCSSGQTFNRNPDPVLSVIDNNPIQKKPDLSLSVKTRFLVTHGQKFYSVPVENIAYFFSNERFVFLMTYDQQKFMVDHKLEELEDMLDRSLFFRINRSFIISINAIDSISPYFGSRIMLKLTPATMKKDIIVSRHRLGAFKAWLGG